MNITTIHYLNFVLGTGAIILQTLAVVALAILFFGPKKNKFLDFTEKHFFIIGFLVSLFATLFSLVYSEIIKFPPCELCWFQRIFLYPQVFIFGVALWDNYRNQLHEAKNVIKYSLPLLVIGFVISVYQNFIYYFGNQANVACDASGVSCYQHLIYEFGGYISIPMLSLTSFFAILAITFVIHFYKKGQ
jgi:disulfide bond formation protein DsbB